MEIYTLAKKDVVKVFDNVTVEAGSSVEKVLYIEEGKTGVSLTVKCEYGTATAGINIYVYYSQDGINFDTDTDSAYTLPYVSNGVKQKTFVTQAVAKYMKIVIENPNSSNVVVDVWALTI